MSEITLSTTTDQSNLEFHKGMVARMETAFHSYGDYKVNYKGRYNKKFLKDVRSAIEPLIEEYKRKGGKSTTANGNAIVFALERLLLYLVGGQTRGGDVEAGNVEYLMDAGNGLMIEFTLPQVPKAKFEPGGFEASPGFVGSAEGEAQAAAGYTYGNRQGDS
jgi:hypothetical protein